MRRRAFALLPAVQTELLLFSPYFIPGETGLAEFRALRERGVQIRVVTNSLRTSDEPLVSIGRVHYGAPLLHMGVQPTRALQRNEWVRRAFDFAAQHRGAAERMTREIVLLMNARHL